MIFCHEWWRSLGACPRSPPSQARTQSPSPDTQLQEEALLSVPQKADFSQKTTSWCTAPPPPMSFCSLDPNAAEREVHVIVIPDDVEIRNVSIGFVSQQKITLVLKGPNGTLWTIPAPPDQLSILCSNQFLLPDFLAGPTLRYVKDSAQSFWTNVQLKVGNFTSYTEIRGGGSSLRLVIGRGDRPAPEPRPSAAEPAAGPWPPRPQTPLQLQLSDGPDHRTPLPSAQITPGSMIYANVSSWNRPFLTLAVTGCRVRSCPATRELLLVTQSCSSFSCLLVLSLPPGPDQRRDQWQEQPSLGWVLECTVQLCSDVGGKTDCEARSAVRNVEVLGSSPRPSLTPPERCLDFGLSAVLGIAFGGFLIGILFTGALWFIQVRTGAIPEHSSSLSDL
ncbi:endoglin-like isoform X3 [Conger conger]|uniref:endoglin-like isoform X3 n=1 Tax=Conger conger TaxID=82655 RepID=UPI002A599FC9|nr:endoglin-like isoform X3 [Conger conger]